MNNYSDIEAVCAACHTRYPAGQWACDEPLTDETAGAIRDAGEAVEAGPLVGDVETEGAIGCAICGADQMMLEAVEAGDTGAAAGLGELMARYNARREQAAELVQQMTPALIEALTNHIMNADLALLKAAVEDDG